VRGSARTIAWHDISGNRNGFNTGIGTDIAALTVDTSCISVVIGNELWAASVSFLKCGAWQDRPPLAPSNVNSSRSSHPQGFSKISTCGAGSDGFTNRCV